MKVRTLLLGVCLGVSSIAAAVDFKSVAEAALLYDAPSKEAKPVYAIARGTPVEVVVILDPLVKIRDQKGDLAWIEKRLLSEQRNVIVRVDRARVYSQADEKSAQLFEAGRDVLLELIDTNTPGWVRVRHRDGAQGFIKAAQVWGL